MSRAPAGPPAVSWYVSLRSPYSWLAWHDAQRHHPDLLAAARLRVFFEPDAELRGRLAEEGVRFPYVPMSDAKHRYILRDVARAAAGRGLRPTWPVDREPDWTVPSLAVLAAREHGDDAVRALVRRLTWARWTEGVDVTAREAVAACAVQVGLPPTIADASLVRRWRDAGLAELRDVERDGVFGVPFVVVGRQPFWGVERLAAAAEELDRATSRAGGAPASPPASPPDSVLVASGAPDGHAGGCG